jgi:hypothetical protein
MNKVQAGCAKTINIIKKVEPQLFSDDFERNFEMMFMLKLHYLVVVDSSAQ